MHPGDQLRTAAVVALKPIDQAKSRLRSVTGPLRRQLAWAMALDTLGALVGAVNEVLVVSRQPGLGSDLARAGLDVSVAGEPEPVGMNAALRHGTEILRTGGSKLVLACVADLPALRTESVRRVLAAAGAYPRSFVADRSGVGTTMLLARGTALDPHYQGPSAAAHAESGAVALTDALLGTPLPDARQDVDTEADLRAAWALGLGPTTSKLLDSGVLGAA